MRTALYAALALSCVLLAYFLGTRSAPEPDPGAGQPPPHQQTAPKPSAGPEAPPFAAAAPSQPAAPRPDSRPDEPSGRVWASPAAGPGTAALPAARPEPPLLRVQLRPRLMTVLSSQMSGRLREVLVEDGQPVAAGQLLFSLDCAVPEAQLERARAARTRRDKVAAVTAQLAELKSRSVLEVEVSRAEAAEAAAEVKVGEALVARCRVAAPFDGRAGEVLARPGQHVAEGQPVLEVLSERELEVEFVAPSSLVGVLKPGLVFPVEIDETGAALKARVERLGGKVDPVSQSVKVYARLLDQPAGLMVGMSGVARLEGRP